MYDVCTNVWIHLDKRRTLLEPDFLIIRNMRGGLNYETQPKQNYGQDSSVLLRSNTIGENVVNQTKQTSRARRRFDND